MDSFLIDLKHAARMFLHSPGFTVPAIAALTLGIATNTAIFSVINTVLLKPFAYPDPGRIVMFQNTFPTGRGGSASPTEFHWWRQQTQAFQDVSAYSFNIVNLTGEAFPEQIPTMRVSADFFRLCGAKALHGRMFTAGDDLPNAPHTAVLAYAFWQRRFGGDPHVLGRQLTLAGERYEIAGVLDPRLQNGQVTERSSLSGDIEIYEPPDVYVSLQLDPDSKDHSHYLNVAGRLKPGVTLAAANAQLQGGYPEFARSWPGVDFPGRGFGVQPLQHAIVGGVRNALLVLLGAVGFVLLIACANVANLILARSTGRRREMAIRVAVGAARGQIVRQLLVESLMLSLIGGVLGLAAGYTGIRAILHLIPGTIPRIGAGGSSVSLDWRVFGFTVAISILTGVLFGLLPALEASRAGLSGVLKEAGNRNQTRAWLVTAETMLAVILLIGAALLIRSFIAVRAVNPGFDAHYVLTMRMSLTGPQFQSVASAAQVIREGVRRIREIPGVEVAATTCCVPLEDRLQTGFRIAGRPGGPDSGGVAGSTPVSAGYFEALRIPILRGRTFTERDESGPPVVIINQALATRFWPHSDPLKDRIVTANGSPRQIVGVVGDVRDQGLHRDARPILYISSAAPDGLLKQLPWAWVIRTRVPPLSLSSAIRKELGEASNGLPVAGVRTMEEILSRSMATENFNTVVLTIFGCSALALAAIGIYGMLAYSVAQRVREIGIRLALGAPPRHIRNMVALQGLRPALVGVVCGIGAACGLTRLIAGFLFGVTAWDPLVFSVVPVTLAGVSLAAVWLPAVRASRVDPIQALRHE